MRKIIRQLLCFCILQQTLAIPLLPIQKWQTPKNTSVWLVSRHNLPIIDIAMVYDAGSKYDKQNLGIAALTNSMLTQGTNQLAFRELNRQLTLLGSNIASSLNKDYAALYLRTRSKEENFSKTIKIFSSIIKQPKFPQDRLIIKKSQQLMALNNQSKDPSAIANNIFFQKLYPNHPYGNNMLGNKISVSKINSTQIKDFFKQHYSLGQASIVIVGDIDITNAKKLALELEKSLPKSAKSTSSKLTINPITKTIQIPFKSKQTTLILGQASEQINDKNIVALKIGNSILGGGMSSHLFKNIRETKGWAYMIFSQANTFKDSGNFYIKTQTQQTDINKVIEAIRHTLSTFINQGPSAAELATAKAKFFSDIYSIIGNNYSTLELLCDFAAYNRSAEYFNNYIQQADSVSKQDIQKVFLNINPQLTILVGPTHDKK